MKAKGLSAAKSILAARADRPHLVSLMREWSASTADVYTGNRSKIAEHPATAVLAQHFDNAGLNDVADHLRRFGEETGPIHPGLWLFALLLGQARAFELMERLAKQEWCEANLWGHESFGAWEAYADEITCIIASDEAARLVAWSFVDRIVQETRDNPCQHVVLSGDRTSGIKKAFDDYRAKPDLKEVWETQLASYVLFTPAYFFKLLGRVDPKRYIAMLAQLPHPVFVEQALGFDEPDRDLAALISDAPAGFDELGNFLHQGAVIVTLLRAAETHIRRCAWEGGDAPVLYPSGDGGLVEAAAQAATAVIAPILDALFTRTDAEQVGWAWLEHLIFQAEHRGIWRVDRQQGNGIALDAARLLIMNVAERLVARQDYREWIAGNQPLWQIDRLMAVLAVGLWGKSGSAEYVDQCLDWALLDQVVEYAGADAAIKCSSGIVGQIGAACILSKGDPALSLRSLWQRTRPVRERAWRSAEPEQAHKCHIGELVALWGMRAFELGDQDARARLEPAVEGILRDAYQTYSVLGLDDFWTGALRRFARTMRLPGDAASEERTSRLASFLCPFARPSSLILELILVLEDRQISGQVIRTALANVGVDLDGLVRTFFELEDFRIRRNIYSKAWLKRVKSLAP